MNRAALFCLIALGACTLQDRAAIARTVADIAAEVCVEGDTVRACLRKCDAAAPR
jgi:hypothetical protein